MYRFLNEKNALYYLIILSVIAITAICITSLWLYKNKFDSVCNFKIVERNGELVPLELNSLDGSEPIGHFERMDGQIGLFLESTEVRDVTKCFQDYQSQLWKIMPYK